jgi:hypothetical protein
MTAVQFCYWLQGYFEIVAANPGPRVMNGLTPSQTEAVKRHLAMVFAHDLDPKAGGAEVQEKLNHLHDNRPTGDVVERC